ncbi:hypothetical protein R1sor_012849 [Riccia sorocarpa]|uniref:Uncharacterized protein n=1 Tax=Riccia sorocarpa TaxID=122646 RepID=A0ABD3I512_9MARC
MDMDFDSNIDDWNEDIDLVDEDWEALNGNRWYQENPAISYPTDAVASEGGTALDDWQRSIRNVRREIDIGGKTLQEVESAASRVRFGEVFSSFKEFEFSVYCWCVINMRSSSKFKTKSNMRVRVCRFGLAVRKKGMGNITEWPGNSVSQPVSQRDVPHVLGVRSFNDFNRRLRTPSIPVVRRDRPDLNLHSQDFVASSPRRRKKRCNRGECGEKPRYDAAAMVRAVNDAAEEEEEEEDIEEFNVGYDGEDEQGCKGSKKPQQQAQRCEWRISIQRLRSEAVMIVSDRQKGLERAVTEVLPCNPHMHCGHHLKMNVQKLFGKTAVQVF